MAMRDQAVLQELRLIGPEPTCGIAYQETKQEVRELTHRNML